MTIRDLLGTSPAPEYILAVVDAIEQGLELDVALRRRGMQGYGSEQLLEQAQGIVEEFQDKKKNQ